MRWFKVAAIAVGALIAFLVISSVVGFFVEALIAVLVVATLIFAVKAAFYRKQALWNRPARGVREARSSSPRRRQNTTNVDDELARLKREMGG